MNTTFNKYEWSNPDKVICYLKCTTEKYAKSFVELGEIKFSTPRIWAEEGVHNGDGRGDAFEGTIACCQKSDHKIALLLEERLKTVFTDIEVFPYQDNVLFKRSRTLGLPCFCLFGFTASLLKPTGKVGKQDILGGIPGDYFQQFTNYSSPKEYIQRNDCERPATVVINNPAGFFSRLKEHLNTFGLKDNEIEFEDICYSDAFYIENSLWERYGPTTLPYELVIKRERFKLQNEHRVIINTNNISIIKRLLAQPIRIGSLKKIAGIMAGYPLKGSTVVVTADINKSS